MWQFLEKRLGKYGVIASPWLWMFLFFLLPFFFVLQISFTEAIIARPPYSDIVNFEDGFLNITLNLGNYQFLLEDELYYLAYLNSLKIALVSTVLALLIGYPMAYAIARARPQYRNILLLLIILPFWTSFLIRVYAWIGLLKKDGLINQLLVGLGLVTDPQSMLQTDFAVYVGIVYSYLPFMILPIYATLEKMDISLLEAAADLGCRPIRTFFTITVPLSMPGIIAGCMLVFIPVVGEFVIPSLLGGPDTLMIGRVLWNEFFANRDWPVASAVAVVMLILLVGPIMFFQYYQAREVDK